MCSAFVTRRRMCPGLRSLMLSRTAYLAEMRYRAVTLGRTPSLYCSLMAWLVSRSSGTLTPAIVHSVGSFSSSVHTGACAEWHRFCSITSTSEGTASSHAENHRRTRLERPYASAERATVQC